MSENVKKVIHLPKIRMLSRGRQPGLRITNVRSSKPPDKEADTRTEEEKLRQQLTKEIELRSRSCAHKIYDCTLPVLCGRSYCSRHILDDPTAPYRQCAHTYGDGTRCRMPAPSDTERRDPLLCFEHARAAMASRQRSAAAPPPVTTTETLLNQLQHYVRPERTRTTSCASSVSVVSDPADQELGIPHAVDPFKQIDAVQVNNQVSLAIMECASASDSDADSVTLGKDGDCRSGAQDDLSGDEETDYDSYPLRHAGVFTAEEAVSEARNILVMLQSSYKRQMSRLDTLLRAARCQYIKSLKTEKEQYCSINTQARSAPLTVKERRQLRKLKAYASFHKKHGADAILARKLHKKRAKANEASSNRGLPSTARCTFTEYGVRCANHVVPANKFCLKHVLNDPQQVLFMPCADARGCVPCREPIAKLPLPSLACRYHTDPPIYSAFNLKKEETETASEIGSDLDSEDSHIEEASEQPMQEDNSPTVGHQ